MLKAVCGLKVDPFRYHEPPPVQQSPCTKVQVQLKIVAEEPGKSVYLGQCCSTGASPARQTPHVTRSTRRWDLWLQDYAWWLREATA